MGDIFGGGDSETTVTYETPPQVSWLAEQMVNELQALRPLAEQTAPGVQSAIQQYIQQYQNWLGQSPEFFKETGQRYQELTEQAKQELQDLYAKIGRSLNQYIQQAQERAEQAWEEAIGRAGGFWDEAIGKAGSFWDEVRKTLLQDIQEAEQKVPQIYEEAKTQTKELTQDVLQDALRNTIRKMALQGLVSQTAGTQAMAEQFRQYEYEPLQRLTEAEAEARRKLEETALGYKTDVGEKKAGTLSSLAGQKAGTLSGLTGQEAKDISSLISQGLGIQEASLRDYASNIAKTIGTQTALQSGLAQQQLGFQLSLPEIYREITQAQQQYALAPFELRRSVLGTLTGSAGALQSLFPANVTQSTSGGINPIFGGLVGTAGTLGLFKLFGLI